MFRQRGSHCANILTDFNGINVIPLENTENGFPLPLPEPYVVPGDASRGILSGRYFHHVRLC